MAPVIGSSSVIAFTPTTPLTEVNSPPTTSLPSGVACRSQTMPLRAGRKLASHSPVVTSKPASQGWAILSSGAGLAPFWTFWKPPPTYITLPIWAKVSTSMFSSLGAPRMPVTPQGVVGEVVEETIGRTVLAGSPSAGIGAKPAVVSFGRRNTWAKGSADFSLANCHR